MRSVVENDAPCPIRVLHEAIGNKHDRIYGWFDKNTTSYILDIILFQIRQRLIELNYYYRLIGIKHSTRGTWNVYWTLQTDTTFWSPIRVLDRRCIAYLNSQKTGATTFSAILNRIYVFTGLNSWAELFVLLHIKFWAVSGVLCRSVHCSLSNVFAREFRVMFSILGSGSVGLLWSDERQR